MKNELLFLESLEKLPHGELKNVLRAEGIDAVKLHRMRKRHQMDVVKESALADNILGKINKTLLNHGLCVEKRVKSFSIDYLVKSTELEKV